MFCSARGKVCGVRIGRGKCTDGNGPTLVQPTATVAGPTAHVAVDNCRANTGGVVELASRVAMPTAAEAGGMTVAVLPTLSSRCAVGVDRQSAVAFHAGGKGTAPPPKSWLDPQI